MKGFSLEWEQKHHWGESQMISYSGIDSALPLTLGQEAVAEGLDRTYICHGMQFRLYL
jgi:hypothetical protein